MKQINLTKRTAATFGIGVILAMSPLGMAQVATPPGADGAAGQTSATANDPGSIDTSQKTTTTTTTTKSNGGGVNYEVAGATDTAPLPNTGGDPLLFVLAGSMLIGGGWVLRRKMAQGES